jgi:translation initiation factor 2-alpha kinase 4
MAWKKPSAAQKKQAPAALSAKSDVKQSFPDLQSPAKVQDQAKTQYDEVQQEEVMVLQSIYGDDFVQHQSGNVAWKVR